VVNNSNLPKIFEVILYTFSHGVFDEDTEELRPVKLRMITIMKMLKANDQVFQSILGNLQLNSHQQEALQKILL
jgi:hypothetical protein